MFNFVNCNLTKVNGIINHSYKVLVKRNKFVSASGTIIEKSKSSQLENLANDEIEQKIVYNSKIKHGRVMATKIEHNLLYEETHLRYNSEGPPVLALKYFANELSCASDESNEVNPSNNLKNELNKINLPYERHHHVTLSSSGDDYTYDVYEDDDIKSQNKDSSFDKLKDKPCKRPTRKWMADYDKYAEIPVKHNKEDDEEENNINLDLKYGTADPDVPASLVPCGGCGAHLHCQDPAIPGYLPKELFVGLRQEQLQALVCQRCHFLREYDTALSVSVDPQIYPQLLSQIKSQKALVILVVDMTDFPCSIWPGILDVIGPKRPLIVVGNKIDLLQDWSKDWLLNAKKALVKQLPPKANLLHVMLVSAKTGYGIEQLITSLYNLWEYRGDVYLVGCTNVGKSTLFNALLQSDYCKSKAVDLIQRATTSPWPGTTLNLLKFPIMRPDGWRLAMRTSRLRHQSDAELRHYQKGRSQFTPQMISQINRTFVLGNTDRSSDDYWDDPFAIPKLNTLRRLKSPGSGLDPVDPVFAKSKWLYDTPGVITPDQIINLLTTEELLLTLPREPITPRTFQVWPGQSLLIAGLGRLDYISGPANIKMTVLAAFTLPITICFISHTEAVYQHYLGSEVLAVPCGGEERLKFWPGLEAAPEFVLKGGGWKESCADIVLSSAGWIALTAQQDTMCHLQAWTPSARGIHVRIPPVLPRAIALKGCKMNKSQSYALFNKYKKDTINR